MTDEITRDQLMRFLDGELPREEHARVESALARDTELARELAVYRSMKTHLGGLTFDVGNRRRSVWDGVNRRLTRPIGWVLLVGGLAAWSLYGAYVFATGPSDPWEKLATGAVVIGTLLLLASVIWERYREYLSDPYRDVYR